MPAGLKVGTIILTCERSYAYEEGLAKRSVDIFTTTTTTTTTDATVNGSQHQAERKGDNDQLINSLFECSLVCEDHGDVTKRDSLVPRCPQGCRCNILVIYSYLLV